MTTPSPTQRRRTWSPFLRSWFAILFEQAPRADDRPATATGTHPYRLSRTGQISLGLALAFLAFLLYGQTLAANLRLSKRFAFCLPLPSAQLAPSEGLGQVQSLINDLATATPAQKLRLRQQSSLLLVDSARLCGLASLNHSQEAALMTVATAALCLLTLTVALGLSHGFVNNTSRTLHALQVTAAFLLVVPMVFLQLGEQVRNTNLYLRLYLAHRNLHQQLLSALANQDLPVLSTTPIKANGTAVKLVPGLTNSTRVAELIRRIDSQLQALPPVPLNLNDWTVNAVYDWLTSGMKETVSK